MSPNLLKGLGIAAALVAVYAILLYGVGHGVIAPWLYLATLGIAVVVVAALGSGTVRSTLGPAGITVVTAAVAALAAFSFSANVGPIVGAGTPAPSFGAIDCTDTSDTNHARLIQYAAGLTFDAHRDAMDFQRLMIQRPGSADPTDLVAGPEATVWPEAGAHLNRGTDLDAGRIVAKVYVRPDTNVRGYPKLNLPPDTSWIAICRGSAQPGQGYAYASLIVPVDPNEPMRTHRSTRWHPRHPNGIRHARAKWQYQARDDGVCMSCERTGWCELEAEAF